MADSISKEPNLDNINKLFKMRLKHNERFPLTHARGRGRSLTCDKMQPSSLIIHFMKVYNVLYSCCGVGNSKATSAVAHIRHKKCVTGEFLLIEGALALEKRPQ